MDIRGIYIVVTRYAVELRGKMCIDNRHPIRISQLALREELPGTPMRHGAVPSAASIIW